MPAACIQPSDNTKYLRLLFWGCVVDSFLTNHDNLTRRGRLWHKFCAVLLFILTDPNTLPDEMPMPNAYAYQQKYNL